MYVCPDCKTPLEHLRCERCDYQYSRVDSIPILLSRTPRLQSAMEIAAAYDSIYRRHSNVWENQGRTREFIDYFASLLSRFQCARFLEIGCGEGFLLASLKLAEKFAVDLSTKAITAAQTRTQAHFSVALAERLPFPGDYFDLVASVGVMEHFLDIKEATQEIRRVLKPGGFYVAQTDVYFTFRDRLAVKIAEYVFPRPRPIGFVRWLGRRLKSRKKPEFPEQPIQNTYTLRGARAWFEDNGLAVIDVLHTRRHPELPLIAPWAVIYIAQKRST